MKRSSSCRLRKVACPDCGYVIRVTRSWMTKGLPVCACGAQMTACEASDLAFLGIIGADDMPAAAWTQVCRENGWDDAIIRKGRAVIAHELTYEPVNRRRVNAAHCAYAGCGRWVAAGAEQCSAGHAQHEHAELEAMPF